MRFDLANPVERHSTSAPERWGDCILFEATGAQERTRTSTPLRAPAPEAGASTNSATWALVAFGRPRRLKGPALPCQSRKAGASAPPMIERNEQLVTVFGGAGFIGRYVCELLFSRG